MMHVDHVDIYLCQCTLEAVHFSQLQELTKLHVWCLARSSLRRALISWILDTSLTSHWVVDMIWYDMIWYDVFSTCWCARGSALKESVLSLEETWRDSSICHSLLMRSYKPGMARPCDQVIAVHWNPGGIFSLLPQCGAALNGGNLLHVLVCQIIFFHVIYNVYIYNDNIW